MEAITGILVILLIVALIVAGLVGLGAWWEQQERDRKAAEAERERAELKAALLRFQAETNAAAHEARKALIMEALRYGQRSRQSIETPEEGSR